EAVAAGRGRGDRTRRPERPESRGRGDRIEDVHPRRARAADQEAGPPGGDREAEVVERALRWAPEGLQELSRRRLQEIDEARVRRAIVGERRAHEQALADERDGGAEVVVRARAWVVELPDERAGRAIEDPHDAVRAGLARCARRTDHDPLAERDR